MRLFFSGESRATVHEWARTNSRLVMLSSSIRAKPALSPLKGSRTVTLPAVKNQPASLSLAPRRSAPAPGAGTVRALCSTSD